MVGYVCTLPNGEVTRFSSMVGYYYLLDRETYHAVRCTVEPVYCNTCQKIVEAESFVMEDDLMRHIEGCRRVGVSEVLVAELELLRVFLTSRISGKKCLTCGSEDLVTIQANLDAMLSGSRYYVFLNNEGDSMPIEPNTLQMYLHGGKKMTPNA
jgi:hypothetical protein